MRLGLIEALSPSGSRDGAIAASEAHAPGLIEAFIRSPAMALWFDDASEAHAARLHRSFFAVERSLYRLGTESTPRACPPASRLQKRQYPRRYPLQIHPPVALAHDIGDRALQPGGVLGPVAEALGREGGRVEAGRRAGEGVGEHMAGVRCAGDPGRIHGRADMEDGAAGRRADQR